MKVKLAIAFFALIIALSIVSFAELTDNVRYFPATDQIIYIADNLTYPLAQDMATNGYIVEFKEAPVLVKKAAIDNEIKELKTQAAKLRTDAEVMTGAVKTSQLALASTYEQNAAIKEQGLPSVLNDQKNKITNEQNLALADFQKIVKGAKFSSTFKNAFNGAHIMVSASDAQKIKMSPYVKSLYPNVKVQSDLMDSVPLTNATLAWSMLDSSGQNITGKGKTIAIIDTGVDYTHPDLGGCFGPTCKVIGGYDFVNNDANPMDDHGHGTHCAATAAGNWVYRGVAPDAKIYAYKVLDSGGSGWSDDIIAAIERAMDPNNDGNYSDHVDVISMSLGGSGNPDDPMCKAIDNAADVGVVSVIAAGNSGPSKGTVGSPGTARKAITIGASTKWDYVAYFSSRGPVTWSGGMILKPDVVAPGYQICAAEYDAWYTSKRCVDDKHINISGTSMATPHVAGLVALIRQAHPEWTPEEVKTAIKSKARQLQLAMRDSGNTTEPATIYSQGFGRVDAYNTLSFKGTPPVVEIITGGIVQGNISVYGTVKGTEVSNWTLYYATSPTSLNWTKLSNGTNQVENGTLVTNWDTTVLNDVTYTLKLVVWTAQGEMVQSYGFVTPNNFQLTDPLNYTVYRYGTKVEIKGTILGNVKNIRVQQYNSSCYSTSCYSTNGIIILKTSSIRNETFAILNSSALSDKTSYSLKITVDYSDRPSISGYIYGQYFDSRIREGWPVRLRAAYPGQDTAKIHPAVSDIDNDGKKEIVVLLGGDWGSTLPKLMVFNVNGSLRWARDVGTFPFATYNFPLAISDIDNDGYKEILAFNGNWTDFYNSSIHSELYAFNHDGSLLWVSPVYASPTRTGGWNLLNPPSIAVDDMDRDGNKEITLVSRHSHTVMILDNKGNVKKMWNLPSYFSVVSGWTEVYHSVGDINGDSYSEILFGFVALHNRSYTPGVPYSILIYAYNQNGSVIRGWPIKIIDPWAMGAHTLIGDVNNDGKNEVVLGVAGHGVYVVTGNATILPNWPVLPNISIMLPALGDLNGDGYLEITTSHANDNYILDHSGNILLTKSTGFGYTPSHVLGKINYPAFIQPSAQSISGWNLSGSGVLTLIAEDHLVIGPTLDDIDNNGKIDVVLAGTRGDIFVWELSANYDQSQMYWPTVMHDTERTGCYNCLAPVNVSRCSDGTAYGSCSVTLPKFCDNGTLIDKCSRCGCPIGLSCNATSEACFTPVVKPNNPPTATTPIAMSTFGGNTTSEDLNCASQISDPDGDLMNATVDWFKNDAITLTVMYKGLINQTLTSVLKSSNLSAGDRWKCRLIVTDNRANTTSNLSNEIRILSSPIVNQPPVTPAPSLNSSDGTNTTSGNLNCYAAIMDPNGDRMNASVRWYLNSTLNLTIDYNQSLDSGSLFNSILSSGNLSVGDVWNCGIRLYDGKVYSGWGNSGNLTIIVPPAPPTPPAPPAPPGGGGGGGGAPPSGGGTIVTPPAPKEPCVNKLDVTMPEQIFIPQRVTKQLGIVVKNSGTCPIPSVAAALSLPTGWKANSYIINQGLDVNETQMIGLTILPTDAPVGEYSATLKLDAPNMTFSRITRVWLLENPPYVVSQEGPSASRIFEYIIALILIEFVFGSIVMVVWYKPPQERLPPLPQLGSDLKPVQKSDTFRFR